jgi:hypothetical protein
VHSSACSLVIWVCPRSDQRQRLESIVRRGGERNAGHDKETYRMADETDSFVLVGGAGRNAAKYRKNQGMLRTKTLECSRRSAVVEPLPREEDSHSSDDGERSGGGGEVER